MLLARLITISAVCYFDLLKSSVFIRLRNFLGKMRRFLLFRGEANIKIVVKNVLEFTLPYTVSQDPIKNVTLIVGGSNHHFIIRMLYRTMFVCVMFMYVLLHHALTTEPIQLKCEIRLHLMEITSNRSSRQREAQKSNFQRAQLQASVSMWTRGNNDYFLDNFCTYLQVPRGCLPSKLARRYVTRTHYAQLCNRSLNFELAYEISHCTTCVGVSGDNIMIFISTTAKNISTVIFLLSVRSGCYYRTFF